MPLKMMAMMRPYIAVASQKMTLIRFFDLIRGVFTDAPTMVDPVKKIPLVKNMPFCGGSGVDSNSW